jgi:activator of HSP90 ATPase
MPYDYRLTAVVPASAQEIYSAWLDSVAHSEMTGGQARMSDEIGAEVSAWDGYITGRNLELVPHQRIVQSWRTTEFTDDHGDSIITLTLEDDDGGTLLTLVHSNVPNDQTSYEQGGWQERYFEPMAEYFSKRVGIGKSAKAAPTPMRKRATKKAKPKRKSKRALPKAKKKTVKKKSVKKKAERS